MRIKVILSCPKLLRLIAWQKDGTVDKDREIRALAVLGKSTMSLALYTQILI